MPCGDFFQKTEMFFLTKEISFIGGQNIDCQLMLQLFCRIEQHPDVLLKTGQLQLPHSFLQSAADQAAFGVIQKNTTALVQPIPDLSKRLL